MDRRSLFGGSAIGQRMPIVSSALAPCIVQKSRRQASGMAGLTGLVERDAPLQEHLADPPRSVREVAKKTELQAVVAIEVIVDPVAKEHFEESRYGQSLEFIHDLCSSRGHIVATGGRQRRRGRVIERSGVRVEGISSQ